MAETIYTIPINEAYEQTDRCPFCALGDRYEAEALAYILGPAMMESDVRVETNRMGFCKTHFQALLDQQSRLPLGLILESHLMAIGDVLATSGSEKRSLFGGAKTSDMAERLSDTAHACYVCNRLETLEKRVISNAVSMWKRDNAFRTRFEGRSDYCLIHAAALFQTGQNELGGQYPPFAAALAAIIQARLDELLQSVRGFNNSFDYRNAGKPLTQEERFAVEHTIAFLTGCG
ncbi:MAG: DUF6062 family protein [Oscillospiraceae bacterium]|nr:DUF6062 family protein [Oscillospiraceae bacterium]